MLRFFRLGMIVAAIASAATASASGDTPPPTPTTRILAIGTLESNADHDRARQILPSEVRATVQLYLEGKIDQWYSLQDRTGVVFVLNVTDRAAAQAMLDALPLGRAHLMRFELPPLAPLNPLRQLQGMRAGAP